MSAATERSARDERTPSAPSPKVLAEPGNPEWHGLRLFGHGRRAGAFDAGWDRRAELRLGLPGALDAHASLESGRL